MIWLVVSALNIGTILAFSEEQAKALQPIVLAVLVPAAAYLLGWGWSRLRKK